ncbi:uncharacterized protein LOC108623108 [Ceratina calcarata]|uniref:Uncharacterized protein LOC108623108 n=1 Tax=Ceratina calcarata TaxID=156304 RepID=A0AAJ7ITW4_9HYME|nr:uncharacterized protein LOC108623108 [Ceratina calcarata]
MSVFEELNNAVAALKNTVLNFKFGAASLDDFKTDEEKFEDMRERLKHLNARLVLHKAQSDFQIRTQREPEKTVIQTVKNMHENAAISLINNLAVKLCLHSYNVQAILSGVEGDQDARKQIYACMSKIFGISEGILAVQQELEAERQKQLNLKIECQTALADYHDFLKEQEEIHSQRLQETNPEILRNKEKTQTTVKRICLMQKLITNFIAASNHLLLDVPLMIKMLEDHREMYTMEIISKIAHAERESMDVD